MFTLANMLIGCMAIVYLFYDHLYINVGSQIQVADMARVPMACYLVYVAIFLDYFDGFFARLLKAQSEIGKQLDSMADLITFGLVPGLIMYQMIASSYYSAFDTFSTPIVLFAIGFIVTLSGAIRLAKFNIDDTPRNGFSGLPIPAMAGLIASLPLIQISDTTGFGLLLANKWILIGIAVLMSWLMLSSIPLLGLKIKTLDFQKYKWELGGLLSGLSLMLIVIFVLQLKWLWVPICFLWYLTVSAAHSFSSSKSSYKS
ncbi:MAG: CDP-diacylglycerol--serine O-phosphatidyltransferase [Limisphaerales bacterium]|jgi:CDP-diacylglycerol--serine O-phosphatidyltransferase